VVPAQQAPELSAPEGQSPRKRRSLLSVLNADRQLTPEEEEARQVRLAKRAAADQRELERRLRMLGPNVKVYVPASARR
jgi:hypothetical protein